MGCRHTNVKMTVNVDICGIAKKSKTLDFFSGVGILRIKAIKESFMKRLLKISVAMVFATITSILPFSNVLAAQSSATINYVAEKGFAAEVSINGTRVELGENDDPTNYSKSVNYEDEGGATVDLTIETLWIYVLNGLEINGRDLSDILPSTKEELARIYDGQMLKLDITVDKATTYVIKTKTDIMSREQQFFGNFLWENDETDKDAEPDDIIGKGTISFVKAVYNGVTYNSVDDLNNNCGLTYCNWSDGMVAPHDPDGSTGSAEFPVGTVLTIRLIPDAGYQLVSFGINGGAFEPQENIGEYTFTIRGGNAHLAADFKPVDDAVDTDAASAIEAGSIVIDGEEFDMGTARLDVSDVELTDEQVSNFENAAPSGYNVSNYIDISLFNTVYKGSADDSWDTQVTELRKAATITLQLEDGVDGSNIVIIHEKHDGTYEVIETTYNPVNNTITFTTDSFSNYALATKETSNTAKAPNSGANNTVSSGTASASYAGLIAMAVLVSLLGASVIIRKNA